MSFGIPVRNGVGIGISSAASLRGGSGKAQFYLNFTTGALPTGVSASGGANGTVVNSSGLVAASSAPRFDYAPVTLTSNGILVEASRANLALYSEQFNNAVWSRTSATIGTDAAVAPDGTTSADKIIASATTGGHSVKQNITVTTATAMTLSVFGKAAEYSQLMIQYFDGSNNKFPIFSLVDGSKVSDGGIGSAWSATSYGNGWWRFTITVTSAGTGAQFYVYPCVAGSNGFLGDGTSGVYIWGADLEYGSSASTYIQTVGSTVTRSADAIGFTIPSNITSLTYTFDNNATQVVTVSGGAYTIPTTINRPRVKTILGL